MYMNRQLINQLRVAYFVPNRNRTSSTYLNYRVPNTCTVTAVISQFGMSDFCTPVVPVCCQIPFVQPNTFWVNWGYCQSTSLVHQVRPTNPQLKDMCYPNLIRAKGGNYIVDCSSFYRRGLYNGFHNTSNQTNPNWCYRKPLINLFI